MNFYQSLRSQIFIQKEKNGLQYRELQESITKAHSPEHVGVNNYSINKTEARNIRVSFICYEILEQLPQLENCFDVFKRFFSILHVFSIMFPH